MLQVVKTIIKKFAKSGYRLVTSLNADTLYYGRIYIDKNREKVKKSPIKFLLGLLRINWLCYTGKKETLQKELISPKVGIDSFITRPKVFRFAEQFIGYTDLILDLENCLFVMTKTMNQIIEDVEEKFQISGFSKIRLQYDSKAKTINQIYQEISNALKMKISPDIEIEQFQKSIIINPYIAKVLSIVAYNSVCITAYLDTSYDKRIYERICRDAGIVLNHIETTADCNCTFDLMLKEKGRIAKKQKDKRYIFLTSNYSKVKKLYKILNGKMIYYPSTSKYAEEIVAKYISIGVSKAEKELIAMELFCGMKPFKYEYTKIYLSKAPVFFHLLDRIRKRAESLDSTVIILGDEESELKKIYMKFFEACRIVLWSPLASYEPKTLHEWKEVISQYPRLNKIPVERIMYALGLGTMLDGKDTIHTMMSKILQYRQPRNQEEVIRYINEACDTINSLLLWNPIGGSIMTNTFIEGLQASNIDRKIYSIGDLSEMESNVIKEIVEEMEESLPILLGVFNENYAFALPESSRNSDKELLTKVLEDYFHTMYE
jgi:hypothetical protein